MAFPFGALREMNCQQHPLDMFREQAALRATVTHLALAILALVEDVNPSQWQCDHIMHGLQQPSKYTSVVNTLHTIYETVAHLPI
jgi:hypothetical protein